MVVILKSRDKIVIIVKQTRDLVKQVKESPFIWFRIRRQGVLLA
jgi:hypothetical protein